MQKGFRQACVRDVLKRSTWHLAHNMCPGRAVASPLVTFSIHFSYWKGLSHVESRPCLWIAAAERAGGGEQQAHRGPLSGAWTPFCSSFSRGTQISGAWGPGRVGPFLAPAAGGCGDCGLEPGGQGNYVLHKWEAGSLTIAQPLTVSNSGGTHWGRWLGKDSHCR
jgi:hypothetical protein